MTARKGDIKATPFKINEHQTRPCTAIHGHTRPYTAIQSHTKPHTAFQYHDSVPRTFFAPLRTFFVPLLAVKNIKEFVPKTFVEFSVPENIFFFTFITFLGTTTLSELSTDLGEDSDSLTSEFHSGCKKWLSI